MPFYSPLRYPGGKRTLTNFIKRILVDNGLVGGVYAEPFAGGASVALALLYDGYVGHVYINDLDSGVYAFWHSVLYETEALCRLVNDTAVTMHERERQRSVHADPDASLLSRGFATFFLNRTNRSGIISGGVIGGKEQKGTWKLDARFTKAELVARIARVAEHADRITLSNCDAAVFLRERLTTLPAATLVYLDPPYYVQGEQKLYTTYYRSSDHAELALLVRRLAQHWVVSYDWVEEIERLYAGCKSLTYSLRYTAQKRYAGNEVMFFSPGLTVQAQGNPTKIKAQYLSKIG